MKEKLRERFSEKIFGINWEIKYLKDEIKNANYYLNEAKETIAAIKKKYPKDWQKKIGGFKFDIEFHKRTKADSIKEIKRWEKIKKAHKLGKVV